MMRINKLVLLFFLFFIHASSQDLSRVKSTIKKLCSSKFSGRGYVDKGSQKAAEYLSKELKRSGVKPISGKSFFQSYYMDVNTFPGKMELVVNGRKCKAGIHYLVSPESKGGTGFFEVQRKDSLSYVNKNATPNGPIFIELVKKLTWSVSTESENYIRLQFLVDSFSETIKNVELRIDQELKKKTVQQNICGIIRGVVCPDSFLVLSAHYDHLGKMGKEVVFPGANDNASGVSMLLELAHYFSKNPNRYSIVFLLFSGEEAGLLGSAYFVKNPLIPLEKVRFLVNLDLLGTGEEGITVVNATVFSEQFESLKKINAQKNLLSNIKPRGKAQNSDHYWFTEAGVPAFFIYTMGGIKAYHDVYDIPETLPLTNFSEVFELLKAFLLLQ